MRGKQQMKVPLALRVNGEEKKIEADVRALLVDVIRDDLGLTGTHVGCLTGNCGACTVLLNGVAVKSCTVLGVQADGSEVLTIEGLAKDGQLHPLQKAFIENHGLQCGYCTPGMILAAHELLRKTENPSEDEIRKGISGNLCRCTGYQNITKAIRAASRAMQKTA